MRVPLPAMSLEAAVLEKTLSAGVPMLTFEQIPIDWSDLRFLVRSTADAMRTHEAIEDEDYRRVEMLSREPERLAPAVRNWYEAARPARRRPGVARRRRPRAADGAGDAAVPVALRRRGDGADVVHRLAARQLPALRR